MNNYNSCPYPRQGTNGQESCDDIMCRQRSSLPYNPVLAMAYVPFQQMDETYPIDKALFVGTLFPCLNLPFVGCRK